MKENLGFALEGGLQVLGIGLLLGAGLPLLFALGIRGLAYGGIGSGSDQPTRPVGLVLGGLCFVVVVGAIALGITTIVASGFGMQVDFGSGIPTLVKAE